MRIDFEIENTDSLNLNVNLDRILDEASTYIVSKVLTRFLAETDPEGRPWIPSRAGMARRLKGGTGTLYDTGNLFRSIQVFKTSENQRRIGTDVPYAELMHSGGGAFSLPPRKFLGFSKDDTVVLKQIVELRLSELTSLEK